MAVSTLVRFAGPAEDRLHHQPSGDPTVELISLVVALIAAALAIRHFLKRPSLASGIAATGSLVRVYGALS